MSSLLLALAGLLLIGFAVWARRSGVGVVGPVFHTDLLRTTRRARVFQVRTLYLVVLLVVLFQVYVLWRRSFPAGTPNTGDLARFTFSLFYAFLIVQLLLLLAVTPALTAGAVAEERERRSLAFLLATDLRNHEIVLGKFSSRLVHLLGLLLAGLPVFSLLQLLGGIDLGLVALCFAGTLITVVSVAAVSLLASVVSERTRDAIILSYGVVLGYLGLSAVLDFSIKANELTSFPSTDTWTSPVELQDVVAVVTTGHPVYAMYRLGTSTGGAAALGVLANYALFHGIVIALGIGFSVALVRRVGVGSDGPRARPGATPATPTPAREVSDNPVLWREVATDRGLNGSVLAHVLTVVAVLSSLALLDWTGGGPTDRRVNGWCRVVGTLLSGMMLLQVVLRAGASIRHERDRETLDALLTTPLTTPEILGGKWLGALASVRMLGTGLLTVWAVGLVTGGLHPLAIAGQALAWCVYAAGLASLGVRVSVTATSALRAMLNAVGGALVLSVLHWGVWLFLIPALRGAPLPGTPLDWLLWVQIGLTPPLTLGGTLGFSWEQLDDLRYHNGRFGPAFVGTCLGLALWGAAGLILWAWAVIRFRREFNRDE